MAGKKIRCSFCGKEEKDVRKLIFRKDTPREGVCICDECTMKCMGMLMQEESKAVEAKEETINAAEMIIIHIFHSIRAAKVLTLPP